MRTALDLAAAVVIVVSIAAAGYFGLAAYRATKSLR